MPKRLIVCSDGSWYTPDLKDRGVYCPSNVVKIARTIAPMAGDGTPQIVFYDQGVGTDWGMDRITGGAFGRGLSKNIQDAYRFLVHNYESGDQIYFFGFSRGAYTVRSCTGMIRNSGLLHKRHAGKIQQAFDLYRSKDVHPDDPPAREFRERYAREVRIHFIGVWDTVGALGVPLWGLNALTRRYHEFHDVQLSRSIDNAFHALAIDEKRKAFRPTIWETKEVEYQRVEQAWFPGSHANVGGGFVDAGLSDQALKWMMDRATQCDLEFEADAQLELVEPNPLGELRNSRTWFFKLIPAFLRKIDAKISSQERIDQSALTRMAERNLQYEPKNLLEFLTERKALESKGSGD
ncbi:MAG TPA: DUF2235 domain-containing protein [Calditrichia bacterium]|nr:DUF2235 domain-containing protein [Calditrichota bacterium]HQU74468.1 DUF2235 domain-containing protein [Calditrichia bacterium]HQV31682.1 DUF2235 domain-containing protein [Calditrichia bacterium]